MSHTRTQTTADSVLLASGGLDSTTLAYELRATGGTTIPVFVDYGQHCRNTELAGLRSLLPPELNAQLVILDVADVYSGCPSRLITPANLWTDRVTAEDLYLPYRSLLLMSVGAAYAQAHGIAVLYAAFINSNHAHEIDCSTEFFGRLAAVLDQYGGVEVRLPYRDLTKLDVLTRALQLGVPVASTFSCQASPDVPCGACPNCVDRLSAIAGIFRAEE